MQTDPPRLVIVIRPGARTQSILGWLRQLVPAALLVMAGANVPPPDPSEVVVLDDDDVEAGPLSLADALTRRLSKPSASSDEATPSAGSSGDPHGS